MGVRVFDFFSIIILSLAALICVIPFIFMLSGSLSSESEVVRNGYSLLPQGFTFEAYRVVFNSLGSTIGRAYLVTMYVTAVGTVLGLLITSMSGYVLSRPDFKHRNKVAFFVYFTTLFSGGMIPTYMVVANVLNLNHSLWAIILPGLLSPFNVFLFRNFIKGIPEALMESSRIDGAGDFRIYWQITLPLTKPAIATIGLFTALAYWNNWFNYSLYLITDKDKWGLQYLLYRMLARVSDAVRDSQIVMVQQMPSETMKLATALLVTGPVLLFYPFAQRYFVSGLVVGSVKG
ncbi:sugar ABC transporter permease [Paenibacillus donghaensis]|uniref:Sugar ABC transporter permease n=2 Tax=Paenibacillus donghaensis TaxID=414771 RepID=A0A2Z2KVT6_9BACL|nr:sugar ABC transporter permease [Paenibacillus donghaensis]